MLRGLPRARSQRECEAGEGGDKPQWGLQDTQSWLQGAAPGSTPVHHALELQGTSNYLRSNSSG
jgi:hypothetical protein